MPPEEQLTEPVPEASSTISRDLSSVTASLNATPATQGVRSCRMINSELWIYYNDDINLNSVMESVIDSVPDWEFNRLARSHNAVVFTRGN